MNNNETVSNSSSEELDLKDIFVLFKSWFYRLVSLFFKAVDFILKFWWIILLLIVAGYVLGYFTKSANTYKSSIILKTNYENQAYVYNAIEQFNKKIEDNDKDFVRSLGVDNLRIGHVTIEPIIDVVDLMDEIKNDRLLSVVIEEFGEEEGIELFARDRFLSNYKYHKMEVNLANAGSKEDIEVLINYINEHPYVKELTPVALQNHHELIAHNENSIEQMDAIMESFSQGNAGNPNQTFYNNQLTFDLRAVFEFKNMLVSQNAELKRDLIWFDDAVTVVSYVQAYENKSFTKRKEIIYPIIFVSVFLLLAALRYIFSTLRRKLREQQLKR